MPLQFGMIYLKRSILPKLSLFQKKAKVSSLQKGFPTLPHNLSKYLRGIGLDTDYGMMIVEVDAGVEPKNLPWQRLSAIKA